ncbi:hypothetical protein BB561_005719 [Smittium simulii]|uniref:Ndc10 domain-containing protein n=1 Tax=Smittium simulii TaxID=133385 RepID=A0A2T9Y8V0_9FUNG|nr:hypothetical protein BB561_005719 [Smittium simulii]
MGLEHSVKGIQYSIHEPSLNHEPGRSKKKFYEHQLTFFFTDDMGSQNSDANAPEYWDAIYGPTADVTSVAEQKNTDQGDQQSLGRGGDIPPVEASYIGSTTAKAGILQPTLYNSQEDWRPPTRLRLAETQYSPFGAWIRNQQKKIIDLLISINYAPWDGNKHQGDVTKSPFMQDLGPAPEGQQITKGWPDDIEMSSEFHWEGSVHVSGAASRATYATPSTRTQESVPVKVKIMDINSVSDRSSNPEPTLLEKSADIMERAIILARDSRNRSLHGCQRHSLGYSSGVSQLLRIMESCRSTDAHQCQGTADCIIRSSPQGDSGSLSVGLLRQHNNPIVFAPKEKRGGRPVEKPCQINSHADPTLCPVIAYTVYKERVARNLCPTPHANNSTWTVNRLIRFVNDSEKPLSVDSITRYIHSISVLIHQDQDTPIPKGRAIGATLAANSGVSTDDIVSHAFWSNYSIFDSYYRLTRNSSNNLTESILNIKSHPPSHLPLLKDDKGITSLHFI